MKLSISKPCLENWEHMKDIPEGKYCAVCCKNVVDFTNKTQKEIQEIYNKDKNVCGKFKRDQLNVDFRFSWFKGVASLLLTSGVISLVNAQKTDTLCTKSQSKLNISKGDKFQPIEVMVGQPKVTRSHFAPPLYIINKRISTAKDYRNVKQEEIKILTFLEGKEAVAKYGEAGKEGAVEIETKRFLKNGKK